jgi:hypothetical protein
LALSLLLAAPPARAADDQAARDVARRYAEDGMASHDHGDYGAAVESFTRAYRVLGAPTIGVRLARSLVKLGRLIEAKAAYQGVVATPVKKSDPPVFTQAITEARAELASLTPRIPTLELTVAPGVSSPTLDGSPLAPSSLGNPTPLDPGSYRLSGLGATPEVLVIREGEHATRVLQAAPPPPPPPPPAGAGPSVRRIAGISAAGLSVASVVVGVVESLAVNSIHSSTTFDAYRRLHAGSEDVCVDAVKEVRADILSICRKGTTAVTLQFVLYPAALVLGGVSTYLLLTSPQGTSSPAARVQLVPHFGPQAGGLAVTGTF